jgi:hypothetical protein
MKTRKSGLALSILAGGLSFVGSANATDLLWNGSFEISCDQIPVGPNSGSGTDWNGFCSQYSYSTMYYAGPAIPAGENPGDNFGWNPAAGWSMWDNFTTPEDESTFLVDQMYAYALNQTVSLTNALSGAAIDAGYGKYTFSAWLASYKLWPEQPFLVLRFFDDTATQVTTTGVQIGNDGYPVPDANTTSVIFDRTTNTFAVTYADGTTTIPADLSADHNWIKYVATGTVPPGARKARVYISRSPNAGRWQNGGHRIQVYMDLVKLNVINTNQVGVSPPIVVRPPASQTVALGNTVQYSVAAVGPGPLTYNLRCNGTNIPGSSATIPGDTSLAAFSLPVPSAVFNNAGTYNIDVVVTNAGGATTNPLPAAVLSVVNPAVFVTGQWDFNGNLAATYGTDLQYFDAAVQATTFFNTTANFGISNINGTPITVMKLTPTSGNSGSPGANPTTDAWGGYKMFHGAAANGGGTNVNQYTIIYDVLYPASSDLTWRALLKAGTNVVTGGDDSEFYLNQSDGIGINSIYDGNVTSDTWHRIALAVDLSGPGAHPVVAKFIDGVKVGEQTTSLSDVDGRFSLLASLALLFAENNGYNNDGFVSSVQFSNGRRPDAFIEALGGPSALKIPGVIKADLSTGQIVIRWTGGAPLQSADSPTGTWSTVPGTAGQSSYTPSPLSTAKFYRPQIP